QEANQYQHEHWQQTLHTLNVEVCNPNLDGLTLSDLPILNEQEIICSRLKRNNTLTIPTSETQIKMGDYLHLVGNKQQLAKARLLIGKEVDASLSTNGNDLQVARVVVTNEKVLGKKIADLAVKNHPVVISRLNHAGVELVAHSQQHLHFGDILNLVGKKASIEVIANLVGNA